MLNAGLVAEMFIAHRGSPAQELLRTRCVKVFWTASRVSASNGPAPAGHLKRGLIIAACVAQAARVKAGLLGRRWQPSYRPDLNGEVRALGWSAHQIVVR